MSFFVVVGIVLTLVVPGLGVRNEAWFWAGALTELVATAFAFVIGIREIWWHLRWVLGVLAFLAVGLLLVGADSLNPVLLYLALGPALLFAREEGRRYLVLAGLGTFFALVVPVLITEPLTRLLDLIISLLATVMFTFVALSVRRVTVAQRESVERLRELVAVRDGLLHASREYTRQLERSELERSTAERTLRGVWQAVTEQAMITTDLTGRIEAWNPGAEKLIGLRAAEAEQHRDVVDFLEPDELAERARERGSDQDDGGFATLVGTAMEGRAEASEWNVVSSVGTRIPVHLTVTARLTETGERAGYMFVAHDLTEARAVAKLKDEFVSLISHELRTPLSSIIGYLEILRDDGEPALTSTQLQYVGVAERNAHRLLRLVADLLFTAQVESGTFQLEAQEVDLGPILTASVETAGPAAARGNIELHVEVVVGVIVNGDPVRLSQAIDNLLSNAIKFTPRGGTVTVSLDFDDTVATVTVSDTGMGIPAEEMDKLFGRFFRATTATSNAVAGVGLGLTITRAIVLAHGGSMTVASEVGVGTRFTMTLPLVGIHVPAELAATPA
jgi:PAS domain S-box-containing protein